MNFPYLTSNAFFWWLLAIGIPVLIHFLNRRRHRVVKWAAMDFLLKATRESKGKKKLKHILILACRALAVAALVFAVARPITSNGLLSWGAGKLDTVILILDRSASMELVPNGDTMSKRQGVIQRVSEAAAALGGSKLILIDSATGRPIPISDPNTLSQISQTSASDTSANIPTLLDTALQYIFEKDTGRTEIWLASDMQANNWQPKSGKWENIKAGLDNLADQVSLRILAQVSESDNNLSVQILNSQRIDDQLLLDIEILQHGEPSTQELPLTLSLNGTDSIEDVTLSSTSTKLRKRIPLTGQSGFGYLQLPADTNLRDNTSYFSYGSQRQIRSAVIAPTSEARDYLALASAPPGYANQLAQTYLPTEDIPWSTLSLVIWQAPIPDDEAQQPLLDFINKGGVIAFFPPDSPSEHSFLGSSWGLVSNANSQKYFVVDKWDRNDGPLRNGENGTPVSADKLRAIKKKEIQSKDTVLASWSNDTPFLTRQLHGRGSMYFVGTLPDYTWSNLGDADVILPLIQRLVQRGNQRFGSDHTATLGALPTELSIDSANMKRLDKATSSSPLNLAYQAGVYQFNNRIVAINRPPAEDVDIFISADQLSSILTDTSYSLFEETTKNAAGFTQQLWRVFLVLMLLFLIAEALLCLSPQRNNTTHQK
ncbi:BatA domain-containing protein [Rubritalea spongiae]|uniref:BatA domain-containing protein n=1 Tax=Rubritalea spongiae TaxID=430797 RepID=A0ABW5E0B8_9BACT